MTLPDILTIWCVEVHPLKEPWFREVIDHGRDAALVYGATQRALGHRVFVWEMLTGEHDTMSPDSPVVTVATDPDSIFETCTYPGCHRTIWRNTYCTHGRLPPPRELSDKECDEIRAKRILEKKKGDDRPRPKGKPKPKTKDPFDFSDDGDAGDPVPV